MYIYMYTQLILISASISFQKGLLFCSEVFSAEASVFKKVLVILPSLIWPSRWINFCPGPAGCLRHLRHCGTDLSTGM